MSSPSFSIGTGTTVSVTVPQTVPTITMAPPAPSATLVVPVSGPPGPEGPRGLPGDAVQLAHTFTQTVPATMWLIVHPLPFIPSGIEVFNDVDGHRMYPARISRPAIGRVRLDFTRPVTGTAHLS